MREQSNLINIMKYPCLSFLPAFNYGCIQMMFCLSANAFHRCKYIQAETLDLYGFAGLTYKITMLQLNEDAMVFSIETCFSVK